MPRDYSAYETDILIDVKDRIMTLTLNNPDRLNANTPGMHTALSRIWDDIHEDRDVHVVVLTGAGRAFSAGGNPASMQKSIEDIWEWRRMVPEAKRIVYRMLECDKPIIARVNGHAIGLGATLMMACDIIVAVETAKIGDPHIHAGLPAGDGGALLWPQAIGFPRAKELLLTGEIIDAVRAERIGLINYALPADELDAKVDELARRIARGATLPIQWTKNVLNLPLRQLATPMLELGLASESVAKHTADHAEAVRAMLAKEDPDFTGD